MHHGLHARLHAGFTLIAASRRSSPRAKGEASHETGFTLIELLVVIAIIAILAIVVILVLNPGQLLAQARDSNRLQDLVTMSSAVNLLRTDRPSASLGTASLTYLSLPDSAATSTQGDQCQGLGLPSSSVPYACSSSSTFRKSDGTGWIPLSLSSLSYGSPLGSLPTDPLNQSSSGLFYTYQTNGAQYEVTAVLESSKYKSQLSLQPPIPNYPGVAAQGTNLSLSALWNPQGLVGYWPLDEGSGTIAQDMSGSGNAGTWSGSLVNGSHYAGGKVGSAGVFDGVGDYVNINSMFWNPTMTWSAWVNYSALGFGSPIFETGSTSDGAGFVLYGGSLLSVVYNAMDWERATTVPTTGQWYYLVFVRDTSTSQKNKIYVNGAVATLAYDPGTLGFPPTGGTSRIGRALGAGAGFLSGLIDDVRIYNRALSAAEVMALYNAQR